MRYLRRIVDHSDVLEWADPANPDRPLPDDQKQNPDKKLFVRFKSDSKQCPSYFVFGGDAFDKGDDETVTRLLIAIKDRHPDRVFLLLGNRDLNKLKLSSELCSMEVASTDPRLIPRSFWFPADLFPARTPVTYADWLYARAKAQLQDERRAVTERANQESHIEADAGVERKTNGLAEAQDDVNEVAPTEEDIQRRIDELNTPVNKLKWMLDHTMGCQGTFELRRKEIAHRRGSPINEVTDEDVFRSFRESVLSPDGFVRNYLIRGQLAAVIDNTLFVHGGLDFSTLGFVPDINAHHDHRRLQPLCGIPDQWLAKDKLPPEERQHHDWVDISGLETKDLPSNPFGACAVPVGKPKLVLDRAPGRDYKLLHSVRTWVNKLNRFATISIARWCLAPYYDPRTPSTLGRAVSLSGFIESDEPSFFVGKHPVFGLHNLSKQIGVQSPLREEIADQVDQGASPTDIAQESTLPPLKPPPTFTTSHAVAMDVDLDRYAKADQATHQPEGGVLAESTSPLLDLPPSIPFTFWQQIKEEGLTTPPPPLATSIIRDGRINDDDITSLSDRDKATDGRYLDPSVLASDEIDQLTLQTPRGPRDSYERYRYRGGCEVMGYGYRPSMNSRTVVVQNQFDKSNPTHKSGELIRALNNSGIYRILSGHLPWGDSPGVVEHPLRDPYDNREGALSSRSPLAVAEGTRLHPPHAGLEIIDADTSYSGYVPPGQSPCDGHTEDPNRGNAACEVVVCGLTVTTELDLGDTLGDEEKANGQHKIRVQRRYSHAMLHGELRDGTKFRFNLPPFPNVPFDLEIDLQIQAASPALPPEVRARIQKFNQKKIAEDLAVMLDADPFVGYKTVNGDWWVKARLPPESSDPSEQRNYRYLLSKAAGYAVEYKILTRSEMEQEPLVEPPNAPIYAQLHYSDL